MRRALWITFVALSMLSFLAAAHEPVAAEEEPTPAAPVDLSAKAIKAWGKTCQKCHAVPDARFETDRAFLGQIMETT